MIIFIFLEAASLREQLAQITYIGESRDEAVEPETVASAPRKPYHTAVEVLLARNLDVASGE